MKDKNLFGLTGRTALVMGAGSGIGREIAVGLSRAGATIVCVGRSLNKIQSTERKIRSKGGRASAVVMDVTDPSSVQNGLARLKTRIRRIDILVNSAGVTLRKPFEKMNYAEWRSVIETNLNGTFVACNEVGKWMIRQKHGKIINIASIGSYAALNEATAYCASKGGVLMLTKSLAREWAKYHINVNAIVPGVFLTRLNRKLLQDQDRLGRILARTPFGRLGRLEELVGAAIYLASPASDFVTGAALEVDGGFLACGI